MFGVERDGALELVRADAHVDLRRVDPHVSEESPHLLEVVPLLEHSMATPCRRPGVAEPAAAAFRSLAIAGGRTLADIATGDPKGALTARPRQ